MNNKKSKYIVLGMLLLIWIGNLIVFLPRENKSFEINSQENLPLKLGAGEITIITPENKTYTSIMSGYYPATYGFENDTDGEFPTGWSVLEAGGTANVISTLDGHNKVVEIHDTSALKMEIYDNFVEITTGTIEFFIRCSDAT